MSPFSVEELRMLLQQVNLDTRGNKATLSKRLRKYNKKVANDNSADSSDDDDAEEEEAARSERPRPEGQLYHSFLVLDVEASCEEIPGATRRLAFGWPNEIIEFPVVLLSWVANDEDGFDLAVIDTYRTLVKPVWKDQLSDFCIGFTGITQVEVDAAPTLAEVFDDFEGNFIAKHQLFTDENETVWVCDGPWDLRDFVAKSCYINRVPRPWWLTGGYIDLRTVSAQFFEIPPRVVERLDPVPDTVAGASSTEADSPSVVNGASSTDKPSPEATALSVPETAPIPEPPTTSLTIGSRTFKKPATLDIESVLDAFGLKFEGRAHSGIDDARNIARILIEIWRHSSSGRRQTGPGTDGTSSPPPPTIVLAANKRAPEKGDKEKRWGWMKGKGKVDWDGFYAKELGKIAPPPDAV